MESNREKRVIERKKGEKKARDTEREAIKRT